MDTLTPEQRRRNMRKIKSKNTKIEIILRKALWAKGCRYRKNYAQIPGTPDIAFPKYKIAVFCDSEFFHGRDWETLRKRLERGENPGYWIKKISRNRERDDEVNAKLISLGWLVLRFWGKDIIKNLEKCVRTIEEAISDAKAFEAVKYM